MSGMTALKRDFGRFVADKRRAAGLTQKELATQLFVTESAVSKWERGLSYPDISMVPELAGALGVTSDELIAASENRERRAEKSDAKTYRVWRGAWLWSTLIAYAAAIVTTFIVNLSVQHTLSWFWLVLPAVLLAFSLTTLPLLLTGKHRGWITLGAATLSLVVLLVVSNLQTSGGAWLAITLASLGFAAVVIFGPIWLARAELPGALGQHKTLVSLVADILALVAMLFVVFVALDRLDLLVHPTLLIVGLTLLPAVLVVLTIRYLPGHSLTKAGVSVGIVGVASPLLSIFTNRIIGEQPELRIDFSTWNEATLNGNIQVLVCAGLLLIAVALIITGVVRRRKRA